MATMFDANASQIFAALKIGAICLVLCDTLSDYGYKPARNRAGLFAVAIYLCAERQRTAQPEFDWLTPPRGLEFQTNRRTLDCGDNLTAVSEICSSDTIFRNKS